MLVPMFAPRGVGHGSDECTPRFPVLVYFPGTNRTLLIHFQRKSPPSPCTMLGRPIHFWLNSLSINRYIFSQKEIYVMY